jgi:adenosylcobyric acid synthase
VSGAIPPPGEHGGDGAAVAAALGVAPGAVLDLSASLNPFAPDLRPLAARALEGGVLGRYPDERSAQAALAEALNVPASAVVLTNGGAEAIALVAACRPEGEVVDPEFSLYRRHLRHLRAGAPRWRSNPRTPSGELCGPAERAEVWDEAFYPLAAGAWTRGDLARGSTVLGSLTKVFGCPGLRLGYVASLDEALVAEVRARRPVWSVNGLATALLPELLERADLPRWQRELASAKEALLGVLRARGLEVRAGQANWVLAAGPPDLRDRLARELVVVRDCRSFGLPGWFRLAVPDEAGLRRLEAALDRALAPGLPPRRVPRAGGWPPRRGGLVVCGTGSDAGKSALVAGLCRALARRGVAVAPFKAQNMALNSAVTVDGAEIGRAQAVQAEAAGVPAEAAMNPVLLKPTGDRASQVVVLGRPWAVLDAVAYRAARAELAPLALAALADLRSRFDVVVCEGAGAATEINLLEGDFVNLGLARSAGLPAVVVGDIERGGVFAGLHGAVHLVPADLARQVAGFVVNRFRGDPAILAPGLEELSARTGVPVLGVLPWLEGVALDAEDSLSVDLSPLPEADAGAGELDVCVIRFPRAANLTDLDPLRLEGSVRLRWARRAAELGRPDLVVLPGTKATVEDLAWLRRSGLVEELAAARAEGTVVLGICGGYQMLGTQIHDDLESRRGLVEGLGWLPARTVFAEEKLTCQRRGRLAGSLASALGGPLAVRGYEIHHGRVQWLDGRAGRFGPADPWLELAPRGGQALEPGDLPDVEGLAVLSAGVLGTSLHGIFESDELRRAFLRYLAARRGRSFTPSTARWSAVRRARLDRLADALEAHLDLDRLAEIVQNGAPGRRSFAVGNGPVGNGPVGKGAG